MSDPQPIRPRFAQMAFVFSTACALFGYATVAFASAAEKAPSAVEQLSRSLAQQVSIEDVHWSADASRAVFVVEQPASGKTIHSNLWLYDAPSDRVRQITFAGEKDDHPRWNNTGRALAFLSKRGDRKPQVFLLSMDGAEARALTDEQGSVESFEWSPSGTELVYLVATPEPESPDKALGDDEIEAARVWLPRLKLLDVATGRTRDLLADGTWNIGQVAWLADGKHVVVIATQDKVPEHQPRRVLVVSVADGSFRELSVINSTEMGEISVSPDGQYFAYVGSDGGPTTHDLLVQPIAGGPARNLTGALSKAAIDRSVADIRWVGKNELAISTESGFGSGLLRVTLDGRVQNVADLKFETVDTLDVARERWIYAKTSSVKPPELWVLSGGRDKKVSSFHPDFPALTAPEMIQYEAADGANIEAALYRVPGQSAPGPLVVLIHGGPTSRWSHSVIPWAQLLVASGINVLAPNVRGSAGYGEAFLKSNRGDWGGIDYKDVMSGVDYVVEKKIADANHLGVAGWSYGGYLSAWTITQTPIFKAAIVGAAMLDLNVQWGTEQPDLTAYDSWFIGTPWDNPEGFRRMSPLTHVGAVKTPTLLLVGGDDPIDPPPQNYQFLRALRMRGVPVELIVYPREGHHIREELHQRDLLERVVDWFTRYLK